MAEKRIPSISAVRLISMIFIVACHFLQFYGNELAWWFNVGVQIFLIISGFLYGNKESQEDPVSFICKSFKKILIPYYLFLIVISILYYIFFRDIFTITSFVKAIFCAGSFDGLGHLWFISYILFCYCITPYLALIKRKTKNSSIFHFILFCLIVLSIVHFTSIVFGFYFRDDLINAYIIGYMFAVCRQKYGKQVLNVLTGLFIAVAFILNGFRIYLKYINPNIVSNTNVYFIRYENYSHVLLGAAIFLILYIVLRNLKSNRFLEYSDRYSYSVYIVHQLFILSPFTLMRTTPYLSVNWTVTLIFIMITAIVLESASTAFIKRTTRSVSRLQDTEASQ